MTLSCPGARLGLLLLLAFVSQLLSAQEDSTRLVRDSGQANPVFSGSLSNSSGLSPEGLLPASSLQQASSPSLSRFLPGESFSLPYRINPSLLFRGDYSTDGALWQFPRGEIYGSGGQTSVPGIGRFNDAALMYRQVLSRNLSFQLALDAMKINMSHITGQAFNASGAFSYHLSEGVAFHLFGSYAIGNTYGMTTHRYGATVSADMSGRFGMEVGVQRYYNSLRGRWETVPVAIPYYKFDKFKLGLDVGGLLYEVLRNAVFRDKMNLGGATIAPPRVQLPLR